MSFLLPYEVVFSISQFMSIEDKLSSLTVCRTWYRPVFESLYTHVHLSSLQSFRAFLYIVAHHPLLPGSQVRKLCLYIEPRESFDFRERPMTITEMEILARYCYNLDSFFFHDHWYWYCLDQLELTQLWPRLRRLPTARYSKTALRVFEKLGDRLTDLCINCPAMSFEKISRLLSCMHQLETVSIRVRSMKLDIELLDEIHAAVPQLKHLDLQTQMLDTEILRQLQKPVCYPLVSLQCNIYKPDSVWFTLIKSRYTHLKSLSIHVLRKFIDDFPSAEEAMECIEPIFDLIKHSSIQQINIHIRHPYDHPFIENYTLGLVHAYSVLSSQSIPSISICFRYFDWTESISSESSYITREIPEVLDSSTTVHKKTTYHTISFEFGIGEDYDFDEMNVLSTWLAKPINFLVTHLKLERQIREIDYVGKVRPLFLDTVLTHFPQLISLTFSRRIKLKKGIKDADTAFLTLLDRKDKTRHDHIRYLYIEDVKIDSYIYRYLFKYCPHIVRIELVNCFLDEETVLALEYYCLSNDVTLILK
ncbi:hypothetical protein BD560DRAFT_405081 [Blakeslea trispora]|nr:hypothetical protein BD560DRAFT_405081 [Blakeslea trispora]